MSSDESNEIQFSGGMKDSKIHTIKKHRFYVVIKIGISLFTDFISL